MSDLARAMIRALEEQGENDKRPDLIQQWQLSCMYLPTLLEYRKTFSDGREWSFSRKARPLPGAADTMNYMADSAEVVLNCAFCGQPAQGEHQCLRSLEK